MRWWERAYQIPYESKNFQRILDNYLIKCPVEFPNRKKNKRVSNQGRTFEERNIGGNKLNELMRRMKTACTETVVWQAVKAKQNIELLTREIERKARHSDSQFEMVIFRENSSLKKTRSLFYGIRNAFAHGSFSVVTGKAEPVYYFENCRDGKIQCRMRLRESTLLKWLKALDEM